MEYIQVVQGRLGVEMEGRERVLGSADGEVRVGRWVRHRLYPAPVVRGADEGEAEGEGEGEAITKFLLSGGETEEVYRLDTVFFQNWYGYQDEVVMARGKMDLVQVLCVSRITAIAPLNSFCLT